MNLILISAMVFMGYHWMRQSWREANNAISNLIRTAGILILIMAIVAIGFL